MKLGLAEILEYGDCTNTSRNLREGENLLNSGYVLNCGRENLESSSMYKIIAYCRQYTSMNGKPHEIKGEIDYKGCIKSFTCSCKAGLSGKCKHVLSILLYCNRNDIDELETLSSTDIKCRWKKMLKKKLDDTHKNLPLSKIKCFKGSYETRDYYTLEDTQQVNIKKLLFEYKKGEVTLSKHT